MLLDTAAQAAMLEAGYGAAHAASMPASFTVHLYTADPRSGGIELTATGGYAPLTVANDAANFPTPDADALLETGDFSWTSTAAWSDVATWAQLKDAATGALYNGAALGQSIDVTEAGVSVTLNARIFFNEFGD